jgi:small-conductance mechanosensitive channel
MDWLSKHVTGELITLSGVPVTLLSLLLLVFTFAATLVLARITRAAVRRFVVRRGGAASAGLGYALGRVAQYIIVIIGVIIAFDNIGLSLRAIAAAGAVLSVGLAFGVQNIIQNFVSGLILLIERPVQQGDYVQIGDTLGRVDEIAMRATRVISRDGITVIVPNSELITGRVINLSSPNRIHRVHVAVGVAYASDTSLVREVLLVVAAAHPSVLKMPEPKVFFRAFGDSQLDFELSVWIDEPDEDPDVSSDLRFAIDAAFRARSIEIPFPQRDLHIKSGLDALRV